jgi:phospholipase D1/2
MAATETSGVKSGGQPHPRKPAWGRLAAALIVICVWALAWRWSPLAEFLTRENIVSWSRLVRSTPWAPLVLVLSYTPAALVLLPRPALTLIAIVSFGEWLGFLYSATGIMIAALVTYYAGRSMRPETVLRLAGDRLASFGEVLRNHGTLAVFASNMTPVPPFALQGIIAGAIRIGLWQYTLGSILGMAPGLLAGTLFAREIRNILVDPSSISWWMISGVIVSFAVFVLVIRHWVAKRMAPESSAQRRVSDGNSSVTE